MSQESEDGVRTPGRSPEPAEPAAAPPERAMERMPDLKRETILPAPDRSRVAAVAAMCSLAGIAVGFGLSMFALQMTEVSSRGCPRRAVASAPVMQRAIPYLGIKFVSAHEAVGPHRNVGARIIKVHHGTPAHLAGLRVGDLVIGYDGELVDNAEELVRDVRSDQIGSRPVIDVLRGDDNVQLMPTLDALRVWR